MAAMNEESSKLDTFLQWLQVNGVRLRGCTIKSSGPSRGYGVFSSPAAGGNPDGDGVFMVVPLNLAITPMRVLQDGCLGPRCVEMFKEGHVDDRFLMILFLTMERLRHNSSWKPYIDMLPSTFKSPLWYSEDELAELKGTSLYQATLLQKKMLRAVFDDKVKNLVDEILDAEGKAESFGTVQFEDFLWANSVFWTRALNIPFPHSYVFPSSVDGYGLSYSGSDHNLNSSEIQDGNCAHEKGERTQAMSTVDKSKSVESSLLKDETVWVEGLIPGIDFCNHGLDVSTTWEVDETGCNSGVPMSIYLISVASNLMEAEKEIFISYGDKGNEELLYLYGFVLKDNPDDFIMVHYPMEALQNVPLSDSKGQLLEMQKAELRCLLHRCLLDQGFTSGKIEENFVCNEKSVTQNSNYSWCGQRKTPSYSDKLIFPRKFLASLRTIALQEHEMVRVSAMLEELSESDEQRELSSEDVEAAIWEASGDFGTFRLLVDLLNNRLVELEEGTGTEASDDELLERLCSSEEHHELTSCSGVFGDRGRTTSENLYSSVIYRRGQKHLVSMFLKEARYILELCSQEMS